MGIGILSSGLLGGQLGTISARAGYRVVFSYARETPDGHQRPSRHCAHFGFCVSRQGAGHSRHRRGAQGRIGAGGQRSQVGQPRARDRTINRR